MSEKCFYKDCERDGIHAFTIELQPPDEHTVILGDATIHKGVLCDEHYTAWEGTHLDGSPE